MHDVRSNQIPSNPIKSHQITTYHHISFHIISSHIPTIKLGTAVSAAEAAEAASTVPLHAFALWDPFGAPASSTPDDACVPEVGEHQDEMRQRKHRASHISHFMSFHVLFRAFWALFTLTCVVEPFNDVVSYPTMQIVAFCYFNQCNAFVTCFSFILQSIRNLCARAQRRSISMYPMPCRFVQKRRCRDAKKRINKKWCCNRFLCQTTTIFGIMLCIQMSWSTKQFGDTMALHVSFRESIFQSPYRLLSKLNTSI